MACFLYYCFAIFILEYFINIRLMALRSKPRGLKQLVLGDSKDAAQHMIQENMDANEEDDDGRVVKNDSTQLLVYDYDIDEPADREVNRPISSKNQAKTIEQDAHLFDDYSGELLAKKTDHIRPETWKLYAAELNAGNMAEMSGNRHIYQPNEYINLSRRFVPQYPYVYANKRSNETEKNNEIIPMEAAPEIVEMIAKQFAVQPKPDDKFNKHILRSGDYWNGVWKEEVNPKTALRSSEPGVLGTLKARIKPGTEFHNIVAAMTKISPKLLYIMNVND